MTSWKYLQQANERKGLLLTGASIVALGSGLLGFVSGGLIWAAVLFSGFVRDAFKAIFMTMVFETEGVDRDCAGTALGFVMAISGMGTVLAPPLGNSLAVLWPAAPFVFWSALAVFGAICLSMVKQAQAFPAAELTVNI